MQTGIQLIVGLGNPGPEYATTRHNAGAWWVEQIAAENNARLKPETKFKGLTARITIAERDCWLLIPTTFMNLSGQAVKAIAQYYKIPSAAILVAHDELDFAAGTVRLKQDGGTGGHNGLRDIVANLHAADFYRLRIGIGHPGDRSQVLDYVLQSPGKEDKKLINAALMRALTLLPNLIQGEMQLVMRELHAI